MEEEIFRIPEVLEPRYSLLWAVVAKTNLPEEDLAQAEALQIPEALRFCYSPSWAAVAKTNLPAEEEASQIPESLVLRYFLVVVAKTDSAAEEDWALAEVYQTPNRQLEVGAKTRPP